MVRLTAEEQREQIRREAREDFLSNPGPTPSVEQMRQVGDVLRPAIARTRERDAA